MVLNTVYGYALHTAMWTTCTRLHFILQYCFCHFTENYWALNLACKYYIFAIIFWSTTYFSVNPEEVLLFRLDILYLLRMYKEYSKQLFVNSYLLHHKIMFYIYFYIDPGPINLTTPHTPPSGDNTTLYYFFTFCVP